MRLSSYLQVEALIFARGHLVDIKETGRIEITVGGFHQNREFVDRIEPAIRLEIRHRIQEIDERLADLGVVVDDQSS